jgi:hypothetical protein
MRRNVLTGRHHSGPRRQATIPLIALALAAVAASGCSTLTGSPTGKSWPDDVVGYQCYREVTTQHGTLFAEGYPDYQGGFSSLGAWWQSPGMVSIGSPGMSLRYEAGAGRGTPVLAKPDLSAYLQVKPGPVEETWLFLVLSSGESLVRKFTEAGQPAPGGRSNFIATTDPAFVEAFLNAEWAELILANRQGVRYASERYTLSDSAGVRAEINRLAQEVATAAADWEKGCARYTLVIN